MKFAETLFEQSAPEWRKQYIQYQDLKVILYNALKRAPPALNEDMDGVRAVYFAMFEDQFYLTCLKELQKINAFYKEKLTEASETLTSLQKDLNRTKLMSEKGRKFRRTSALIFPTSVRTHKKEILVQFTMDGGGGEDGSHNGKKRRSDAVRQISDLKLAFSEFYLSLILLKNYQHLNHTGFRKILKKHDKLINTPSGSRWLTEHVERAEFFTNKQVDLLITTTEQVVTDQLEGGNRPRAMKQLRVVPPQDQQHSWTIFKLGLFLGALVVLLMIILFIAIFGWIPVNWFLVFKLYRFPFLLILFIFMMGLNVYGWRSAGVNHVLIFELDPRNHLSEQHLMELAAFFGVFWALSLLTFIYYVGLSAAAVAADGSNLAANENWAISPYINPLSVLIIFFLIFLLNPTKTCSYQARFWFLSVLGRIMAAPFFEVKFADFWLADQLNSLVQILLDFQYGICLFVTCPEDLAAAVDSGVCHTRGKYIWIRSILSCLPAWFRFMQCLRRYRDSREAFPHLANAAKYSTTFFVVIFATLHSVFEKSPGPFFYLWITSAIISSFYGIFWDIRMDWGLIELKAKVKVDGPINHNDKKIKFLRSEITYPFPWLYYLASVQDMLLRFSWIGAYFFVYAGFIRRENMVSVSAVLEIYRRFVWNFFRLENEHLNNCGKFRVVRDISLVHLTHPQYIYRKRQSWVLGLVPQK